MNKWKTSEIMCNCASLFCVTETILGDNMNVRESCSSSIALENKQNMHQREQYYATLKKPLRSPVRDVTTLERVPGKLFLRNFCLEWVDWISLSIH